ncbi:MAG TPA: hypothetical protein VGM33_24635 [Baekduia sp.]
MRIVMGLQDFSAFAGTETYTLTIADELVRLGHEVTIHPGQAGAIAVAARERGVSVETAPERLPDACDAVLAQDASSAYALAERHPDAARLFIAHSEYFAAQSPPQLPGVCHAVVVLNERVDRHVAALASPPPVVRLRQPVDLKRFGARGGQPRVARRALILGNYLRGPAAEAVVAACHDAGLEPVLSGVHTAPTHTPEQAIADVDVVIGVGRCVVEAMAGRRAAYVYGIAGGDGWVTPDTYAALEADGFGGTATDLTVDRARLAADLAAWDPEMGPVNRQLAHRHHDAAAHAAALVDVLRGLGERGPGPAARPPDQAGELARLVRAEWQSWARYAGAIAESTALREDREAQAAEAERLRAENEELRAQSAAAAESARAELTHAVAALEAERARWAAFRATRRFRLVAAVAAPLDALRRRG